LVSFFVLVSSSLDPFGQVLRGEHFFGTLGGLKDTDFADHILQETGLVSVTALPYLDLDSFLLLFFIFICWQFQFSWECETKCDYYSQITRSFVCHHRFDNHQLFGLQPNISTRTRRLQQKFQGVNFSLTFSSGYGMLIILNIVALHYALRIVKFKLQEPRAIISASLCHIIFFGFG